MFYVVLHKKNKLFYNFNTYSYLEAAVTLKPWNRDLSITGERTMTVLTYRGKKYTQIKEASQPE